MTVTVAPLHSYGFDAYPGSFDCSNPSFMPELPNYFTSAHASVDPWGLMYMAEFQGKQFPSSMFSSHTRLNDMKRWIV